MVHGWLENRQRILAVDVKVECQRMKKNGLLERKGHGICWCGARNQGRRENIEQFQPRRKQGGEDGGNEIRDEIHVKIRI